MARTLAAVPSAVAAIGSGLAMALPVAASGTVALMTSIRHDMTRAQAQLSGLRAAQIAGEVLYCTSTRTYLHAGRHMHQYFRLLRLQRGGVYLDETTQRKGAAEARKPSTRSDLCLAVLGQGAGA
ncbi:hypothetical protein V8C35DRAFT_132650 [Trichoderma chlorosporum]